MIYLFTWNNRYLIQQESLKWKTAFSDKHGSENITYISDLGTTSKIELSEALVSRSLFAEKRLVVIDGFPFNGEKASSWASDIEAMIIKTLSDVPEEVLVVFLSANPDKRKSWFKQLSKLAETRRFEVWGEDEVYYILHKKYPTQIEITALKRIIFLKWGDLQKSISEIEKLLITSNHITPRLVDDNIIPEFEESIFVFIDTLLGRDARKIFPELKNLIDFSNLYAIYQSIIANLRIFLYIEYLKHKRISPSQIGDILKLWNRAFLINKSHKSSFKWLNKLYNDLLDFDKNMKFWKFASSDEDDLKRELETIFLKFVG